jgi:hypothetical protein
MKSKRFLALLTLVLFFAVLLFLYPSMVMAKPGAGSTARLGWTPNTEEDLAGYRVYYLPSSQSFYVDNPETAEVDDTLFNPNAEMAEILAGPNEEKEKPIIELEVPAGVEYRYAVTAFDTSDNESLLSNEVLYTANWSAPLVVQEVEIRINIEVNVGAGQ